ncbi:hypothetical protein BGX31_010244 [Mortierella sp. GBA43]|nr:hypothetical protein BGX31_010244 [Mortierella sp. GBA43]
MASMNKNNPSHLDLSHERHEIMQWFKPLAQHASAHADGRQMRERPADDDRKRYSVLQQYGSMSSIRKKSTESATSSDKDSITKGTTTDSASTKSTEPETETDTKAVAEHDTLSSSSSSLSSSSTPPSPTPAADADADATDATPVTSGHSNQDNQNHKEDEQSVSELSLPSLSSSSASSCSSSSSASSVCISLETAEKPQGNSNDKDDDKNENVATPLQESSSSTLSPDSDDSTDKSSTTTATATLPIQEDLVSSDPEPDVKIRRRISLSHVFRSFTTPRNSLYHPNRQSMYEPGQRRGLKASASMPLSHSPLETPQEEIYIWNTVTTKYQPGQSTPLEAR